jgi:rhodanese-related sulfurtransferase
MTEPARTIVETLIIAGIALGVGLVANAMNPDGLALDRDYFRTAEAAPVAERAVEPAPEPAPAPAPSLEVAPETQAAPAPATDAGFDAAEAAVADRLRERGLQPLTHAQAVASFEDPQYAAGLTVFVDARKDEDYLAGHVPGAWQLDHYHLDRYLDSVLPVCQQALQVVVYCHGKDCTDSELTALDLVGFGVDVSRVAVYVGGWTSWTAAGQPVEQGARGAGP